MQQIYPLVGKTGRLFQYRFLLFFSLSLLLFLPVSGQVTANFTANVLSGCSPLTVQFNNSSTGPITAYAWNFGNGNTSNNPNPGVIYVNPGTYTVTLRVTDGNVSDTLIRVAYITVFQDPVVNFTGIPATGCAPLPVNFTDSSLPGDAPITSWTWDFGDGALGNTTNPTHTYLSLGNYDVSLVVTDANGCSASLTLSNFVTVLDTPAISFSSVPLTGCQSPSVVQFTSNIFPAGVYNYLWDFGDGGTSVNANPQHGYVNTGTYTVQLQVTGNNGCQATRVMQINVQTQPVVASFPALGSIYCVGNPIPFFNTSTFANSYVWDFGDGSLSTASTPSHTYNNPGLYDVTLIARDTNSLCADTLTRLAYIDVRTGPQADFAGAPRIGCQAPLVVNFSSATSVNATGFAWDFGDGNTSNAANPIHQYTQPGIFDVSLVATNASGCTDTLVLANYVQIIPPVADFVGDTLSGCAPLTVNFVDLSQSVLDPIVNWIWNFGDGNTSFAQNPTHNFTTIGLFNVSLVVVTQTGCRDTTTYMNYVQAGSKPVANFTANPRIVCAGNPVSFVDLSTQATAWQWFFGDGGTSSQQYPVYTYRDTGLLTVTLIADNFGCMDTLIIPNYIRVLEPVAGFIMTPGFGCQVPFTVNFTDISIGPTSWLWDFGDGTTDTVQYPTHTYLGGGTYIVELVVTNSLTGCSDNFQQVLTITPTQANFTAQPLSDCLGTPIQFTNTSLNAMNFFWNFGDGNTSTNINPNHTYATPGVYDVSLIVTNPQGCADTLIRPAYISVSGPTPDFLADTLSGCAPLSIRFTDISSTNPAIVPITNWIWDFGDGTTSTAVNPIHTYTQSGSFTVKLTVVDFGGCIDSVMKVGYINPTFPSAAFTSSDTLSCLGSLVRFSNLSSGIGNSYLWNFGDGTTSTATNPAHIYPNNGSFTVQLTVTDANGCVQSVVKNGYVNINKPTANFFAAPTQKACPPLTVSFTDQSSPDVISWWWDFGDGSTSRLSNPSKVYTYPGKFTVSLVVANAGGCRDTLVVQDLINLSGPTGTFTFSPLQGCSPLPVTFVANTQNTANWTWDFGDGTLGFGSTTTHIYYTDTIAKPVLLARDSAGCVVAITSSDSIEILAGPIPSFFVNSTSLCLGQTFSFTNSTTSKEPIVQYTWTFGDGDSSNLASPQHTYSSPGSYQVNLLATSINGCFDSLATPITVTVNPLPVADFLPSVTSGCDPLPVVFVDSSTSAVPLIQWDWSFGDGGTSTLPSPSHTYQGAGTYTSTLTVTDNLGCRDSAFSSVTVHARPVADFVASRTLGCAPQQILFTDLSTGPSAIQSWFWDFGDGNTSFISNPIHTYTQDGTYTVSLTVTDANGCVHTETKPHYIVLRHPVANFTSNAAVSCGDQLVSFSHTSTPAASIVRFVWDFGDGDTSLTPNPVHQYALPDTYSVSLIVIDGQGCSDTVSFPSHVVIHEPPQAGFLLSDTVFCSPGLTTATNTSSNGSSNIVQYLYDFGNGVTSTNPTASAIYSQAGLYPVSLVITDFNGCRDTAQHFVRSLPQPVAAFTVSDSLGCANFQINFTALNAGGPPPVIWQWDFGDGTTGSGQFENHIYGQSGNYSVGLMVEDANGCRDTLEKPQHIQLIGPLADFSVNQLALCSGASATFTDLSQSDTTLVSYLWDFGDGQTSTVIQPTHAYVGIGTYQVSLTVTDILGCSHTDSIGTPIRVLTGPTARLFTPDTLGCAPHITQFSDSSFSDSSQIVSWLWNFGNGRSSSFPNPTTSYTVSGNYPVSLIVTDNFGCPDTVISSIQVFAPPNARFTADDTTGCAAHTVSFLDQSYGTASIVSWAWDFGNGDTSQQQFPMYTYMANGLYDVKLTVADQNGCVDSLLKMDYIDLLPLAVDFGLTPDKGCPGMTVSFNDLTAADTTIVQWQWDFGDGTTSNSPAPTHGYSIPGFYTITLTATDTLGCMGQETKIDTIEVFAPPLAIFYPSDSLGCVPLPVQFSDSSVTNIQTWSWDFGDGTTSPNKNPYHVYQNAGNYPVTLVVSDQNGCLDTLTKTVDALPVPVAGFMATDTTGCNPSVHHFFDLSSGTFPITQWFWNFGDTTFSVQTNPIKRYRRAGRFTVSLLVSDLNGCTDTLTIPRYIHVGQAYADFTADTTSGCVGQSVQFSDASTADTTLVGWQWDFGDGATSSLANPSHIYTQSGNFTVQLVVMDELGCTDTATYPAMINIFQSPVAAITAPAYGCIPFVANISGNSSSTNGMTSRAWYIDGVPAGLGQNIAQFFIQVDTHLVSLVVMDSLGCTDSASHVLIAHGLPEANFGATDTVGCAPDITVFQDLSSPTPAQWRWDFGDGATSNQQNPIHQFLADTAYTVSLWVADAFGCEDSIFKFNYIKLSHPVADFDLIYDDPCPPVDVLFNASANTAAGIEEWKWFTGDGNIGYGNPFTYTYTDTGFYDVSLIVTDSVGCQDTVTKENAVFVFGETPPEEVTVHRVTVERNDQIDLVFSPVSVPDFDHYNIYRETPTGSGNFQVIYTGLTIDDTTYADIGLGMGGLNCLRESYCYKVTMVNTCGTEFALNQTPTHCTVELTAIPTPNRMVLNWNAYRGWDVVDAYEIYRVLSYDPLDAEFLDVVPGIQTTYIDSSARCAFGYTYRVKAIGFNAQQFSWSDTSVAINNRVVANMDPPEVVTATVENNRHVLLEWKKVYLPDLTDLILEKYSTDLPVWTTTALIDPSKTQYLDTAVVVNRQSYQYRMVARDSCGFTTQLSNVGTSILLQGRESSVLYWNEYTEWKDGVDFYEVEVYDDIARQWVTVDLTPSDIRELDIRETFLDQAYYCFRVRAYEKGGNQATSLSNEFCIPVIPQIFAPNAFSPNMDGINDRFHLNGVFIETYQIQIFSRWGIKIYEAEEFGNTNGGWDGTYKGDIAPEGVYTYIVKAVGYTGQPYKFGGTITLIR